MSPYRHILVPVELTPDSDPVIQRALAIAQQNQAALSLIHVLEPVGMAYAGEVPFPEDLNLERYVAEQAEQKMEGLRARLELEEKDVFVVTGSPKHEIVRIAKEQGADLIVLGSHGRHGLQLLLGSTANGVLHLAECDVLAVRIRA